MSILYKARMWIFIPEIVEENREIIHKTPQLETFY